MCDYPDCALTECVFVDSVANLSRQTNEGRVELISPSAIV